MKIKYDSSTVAGARHPPRTRRDDEMVVVVSVSKLCVIRARVICIYEWVNLCDGTSRHVRVLSVSGKLCHRHTTGRANARHVINFGFTPNMLCSVVVCGWGNVSLLNSN